MSSSSASISRQNPRISKTATATAYARAMSAVSAPVSSDNCDTNVVPARSMMLLANSVVMISRRRG